MAAYQAGDGASRTQGSRRTTRGSAKASRGNLTRKIGGLREDWQPAGLWGSRRTFDSASHAKRGIPQSAAGWAKRSAVFRKASQVGPSAARPNVAAFDIAASIITTDRHGEPVGQDSPDAQ